MTWYKKVKAFRCDECGSIFNKEEFDGFKDCPMCGYSGYRSIEKKVDGQRVILHHNDEKIWFEGLEGSTFTFVNSNTTEIRKRWTNLLKAMLLALMEVK